MSPMDSMIVGTGVCPLWTAGLLVLVYVPYGQHDCWYWCMSPMDSMIVGTGVCPLWTAGLLVLVYVPYGQHDCCY